MADDDSLLLELLRGLLETVGHECIAVTDGEAAWDHLVSEGADIVISDWLMPGLNGVQLCERIRAHPDIEYPYFILLTSRGDHNDVLTAVRAGVDEHLAKPLDLDVLEARLIVAERVRTLHRDMSRTRRDLEMANRRLDEAAHRDALTGLGNRLCFARRVRRERDRPGRQGALPVKKGRPQPGGGRFVYSARLMEGTGGQLLLAS